MHPLQVASIRRYPVKSMGGESLQRVDLDARGLLGDRRFAVRDADERLASGKNTRRFRRRDAVFDHAARTVADGVEVRRDDSTWRVGEPALDAALSEAMQAQVRVAPESDIPHQDAGAVSIVGTASLAWCAERLGVDADPRRLRVNLLLATEEPFVEETWIGRRLEIGGAALTVVVRAPRCRMIDLDQDGARGGDKWLRALNQQRDGALAVYADVAEPGPIALGDAVVVR